jgi:predicted RNA-binding protein YlxR (DUF448 family)
MVCRERKEKHDLIRIARQKGTALKLDPVGHFPGRGAYLCKDSACILQAQKRRSLERAFSTQVDETIYEQLMAFCKEETNES